MRELRNIYSVTNWATFQERVTHWARPNVLNDFHAAVTYGQILGPTISDP
jgi:hypothetical protein